MLTFSPISSEKETLTENSSQNKKVILQNFQTSFEIKRTLETFFLT